MNKAFKILVPVDFSTTSRHAFDYAMTVANLLKAELDVLHVIYPQLENIDQPEASSEEATRTKQQLALEKMTTLLEATKAKLKEEGRSVPLVHIHVELGGAIAVIKEQVKKKQIDLVVMGTRREHANMDVLLGTVASDVVGNVSCPVIVVPENVEVKDKNMFKVAHALDLEWVKEKDMIKVIQLFEALHQEIHLVRFSKSKEDENAIGLTTLMKTIAAYLSDIPIKSHHYIGQELIEDINQFVKVEQIDLLIMYRSQHGLFRKLFHRSLTRQMAKRTIIPLLVV